jgi:hypothetical protein
VAVMAVQLWGKLVTSAVAKSARKISDGVRPDRVQNSASFAKSVAGKRTATTEVFIAASNGKKKPGGFPLRASVNPSTR